MSKPNNGERDYRTELPNLIDDSDLSPFAFRLYVHIKRVAGDTGKCYQSTRTLADACKMSVGQIVNAKRELLDSKFIKITPSNHSPTKTDIIFIVDLWKKNVKHYATKKLESQRSQDERTVQDMNEVFTTRTDCSQDERNCSPDEPKKEPIKKEPLEESTSGRGRRAPSKPRDPLLDHDAVKVFNSEIKRWPNEEQRKEIAGRVVDLEAFRLVVHWWALKGYNPTNVFDMLAVYDKVVAGEDVPGLTVPKVVNSNGGFTNGKPNAEERRLEEIAQRRAREDEDDRGYGSKVPLRIVATNPAQCALADDDADLGGKVEEHSDSVPRKMLSNGGRSAYF